MDDERLELALRRLPGVLACSLEGDTATLLLDPHASAIDVEAAANALLLEAGDSRPPLVLGGTRPVVAGRRRFDVVPAVKAAGPGVLAVGAAALVASLVTSPAAFWRDTPASPPESGRAITVTVPGDGRARTTGREARVPPRAEEPAAELAAAPLPDRRLVLLVPDLPAAPEAVVPITATANVELASVLTPPRKRAHAVRSRGLRDAVRSVSVLAPTELAAAASVPAPESDAGGAATSPESPLPPPVSHADSVPTIPKHRERAGKPRPAGPARQARHGQARQQGLALAEKVASARATPALGR